MDSHADQKSKNFGYSVMAELPTPLRVREDAPPAPEMSPVCVLDVCPWDSLAQFLSLPELEWLCCASAAIHAEHTIQEDGPVDATEKDGLQRISRRKLLAPLLVLKVETAEVELQRVSLSNVRQLRIWNHRTLDMLEEALSVSGGPQVMRSLERCALKGCPLTPEVISSFVFPAFSHTQLKHLNLEKNNVTDDKLCDLVKSGALEAGCLESLNLRHNMIGSRGVEALCSSKCCESLKWVNLKMNQVGDDGAIALAEMLEGNSSMSLLNLRRQTPCLTDKTAFAFATTLKYNSALEQLRLRQNKITDEGASALGAEVADHVKRLQSFRGMGTHFELDLEQNRIKESGAESLLRSLEGVSRAVKVEFLLHGNWVKRSQLAKTGADGSAVVIDERLKFESKGEGLLW